MIQHLRSGIVAACLLLAAGCTTLGPSEPGTDEVFGMRVDGRDEDGRETLVIVPADSAVTWNTYPAVFESVTVRPAPFLPGQSDAAVEILVKGAFPDACTELHAVTQERTGHLVSVSLEMRRPQGSVCAAVIRPYRFYLVLEGRYAPGPYGLTLNGRSHPFELKVPTEG